MKTSAGLDAFAEALAAFQAEVPVIPKAQTAQIKSDRGTAYSYSYAGLPDVAAVVMPLLAKHGLAFTAIPTAGKERGPLLRGVLLHSSGQFVAGELPITGRTAQEIGSSLTYGRRYLLGCLTGVVTDDDDDGALASRKARKGRGAPVEAGPAPVAPPAPIQRRSRPRPTEAAAVEAQAPQRPTPPVPAATPHPESTTDTPEVSDAARRAMFGAVGKALGPTAQRAERLALCTAILGRRVESSNDLGRSEVSAILDWLEAKERGRVDWVYDATLGVGQVFVTEEAPPEADDPLPEPDPWA